MRINCPNCGAQYEVPAEVIPTEGRDVQCSNCGQTWFQEHPDHASALTPEASQNQFSAAMAPAGKEAQEEVPAQDQATPPHSAEAPSQVDEGPEDIAETSPEPEPREIDPAVADILRQEATKESQARAEEAHTPAPQIQTEGETLVQEAPPVNPRASEARERMLRMRQNAAPATQDPPEPDPQPEPQEPDPLGSSRRALLPDIEETNSTLRDTGDRRYDDAMADEMPESETKSRGGFRWGFMIPVVIVSLLVAAYVFAPRLEELLPTLTPYLEIFVEQVDITRVWLDERVTQFLQWLDKMVSQSGA